MSGGERTAVLNACGDGSPGGILKKPRSGADAFAAETGQSDDDALRIQKPGKGAAMPKAGIGINFDMDTLNRALPVLRLVTEDDLSEVARTWPSDNRPISEEKARSVVSYIRDSYAKCVPGHVRHVIFAVSSPEDPRTIMGWCGLDGRRDREEPEIFVLLDEGYRGMGYGTRCVKELLRIAAEDYTLKSVRGGCSRDNIASKRAMEKGGMVQYGEEDNGDPLFRYRAGN